MIALLSTFAERHYHRRWWFAAVTLLAMILPFGWIQSHAPGAELMAGGITFPVFTLSWALLLTCVWFHPERGVMMRKTGTTRTGRAWYSTRKWYAAIFLVLFAVFGSVGFVAITFFGDSFNRLLAHLG